MSYCTSLKKHLFEHEILGLDSSSPGSSLPIQVVNGILYVFDDNRDVWLSSFRDVFTAGRDGRAKNIYLRLVDGQPSNVNGYRMTRDSVITNISAQSRGTSEWTIHIRKSGEELNLYSLVVTDGGSHDNNVDVRLNSGDTIQFYCESPAFFGIQNPIVWIEVAAKL